MPASSMPRWARVDSTEAVSYTHLMNLMGLGVGECRLPLCSMAEGQLAALREILAQNGLVEGR